MALPKKLAERFNIITAETAKGFAEAAFTANLALAKQRLNLQLAFDSKIAGERHTKFFHSNWLILNKLGNELEEKGYMVVGPMYWYTGDYYLSIHW